MEKPLIKNGVISVALGIQAKAKIQDISSTYGPLWEPASNQIRGLLDINRV